MRLQVLQHVPFEGPARVGLWAAARGHRVSVTRLDQGELPPEPAAVDWVAVMGGPMNIDEHAAHPWLVAEKAWLRAVIAAGRPVVGICLGAQLLADVLGGSVHPNPEREIGWFPVTLTAAGRGDPLTAGLPETFTAFHWHGDTFRLPPEARHLAGSAACAHQIFAWGERVLGLQCHLDYDRHGIEAMIRHCGDELSEAPCVQTDPAVLTDATRVAALEPLLDRVLGNLLGV